MAYIAGNQVASAKAAGFKIAVIPSEVVDELDIQTATAPFNNPNVVKAINYAINRQAILQVQAAGYGAVAYQPFPKGFVGYSAKLANLYPYNPALARQLLAQAGYPHGLKITLSTVSTTNSLAEQIQGQLAQAGITATINDIPTDTETQQLYLNKSIPLAVDGTAGRMSPVEMLDVLYSQQGLMNVNGKTSTTPAEVSAALAKALTVPLDSPDYPGTLQNAVETSVLNEPTHIWLYTNPRILAYSSTVTGIPQTWCSSAGKASGWRADPMAVAELTAAGARPRGAPAATDTGRCVTDRRRPRRADSDPGAQLVHHLQPGRAVQQQPGGHDPRPGRGDPGGGGAPGSRARPGQTAARPVRELAVAGRARQPRGLLLHPDTGVADHRPAAARRPLDRRSARSSWRS